MTPYAPRSPPFLVLVLWVISVFAFSILYFVLDFSPSFSAVMFSAVLSSSCTFVFPDGCVLPSFQLLLCFVFHLLLCAPPIDFSLPVLEVCFGCRVQAGCLIPPCFHRWFFFYSILGVVIKSRSLLSSSPPFAVFTYFTINCLSSHLRNCCNIKLTEDPVTECPPPWKDFHWLL